MAITSSTRRAKDGIQLSSPSPCCLIQRISAHRTSSTGECMTGCRMVMILHRKWGICFIGGALPDYDGNLRRSCPSNPGIGSDLKYRGMYDWMSYGYDLAQKVGDLFYWGSITRLRRQLASKLPLKPGDRFRSQVPGNV